MQAFHGGPMVRFAQDPITDVVLPKVDHGHSGKDDVVEGSGDNGGEDIRTRKPGEQNGQGGLEAKQRHKAEKDADGDAAGNGFRRIANRQKLQRVLVQPAARVHFLRLKATTSSYRTPEPPKMSSAEPMVRSILPRPRRETFSRSASELAPPA